MINRIRLQPLIRLSDDLIYGYEALYRKENRAEFPSADCILRSIFSENKSSAGCWSHDFRLFINMTVKDIKDSSFGPRFLKVLNEKKIDGRNIVLEVSEDTPPDSLTEIKKTLNLLRSHHIKIALDDFGTQYSGLAFMSELPVDIIKIDKKFVQSAPSNKKVKTLLKFIVEVSHDIGCKVVAEGIETFDQLDCVKESNADIGQGFLLSASFLIPEQKMSPFIGLREFTSYLSQKIVPQCKVLDTVNTRPLPEFEFARMN